MTRAACTATCFNTQPPEGGWDVLLKMEQAEIIVSTHSRLKAAGAQQYLLDALAVFQHTAA